MIRIGVKEWFRKKFSIKQHEGKKSLQILETNDQIKKFHLEQEVVKNLGRLGADLFLLKQENLTYHLLQKK